ncbi:MAG: glycoside hydrolase family 3 N-terminal domain-containing protein [Anaerolineales bacterium]|nr:glycoside hydrolase family 3 N-terminal domain-containing protein [Anaerolineales bacterium]
MSRFSVFLLLLIGFTLAAGPSPVVNQQQDPAAEILSRMSPEERVGQLFLITFQGSDFNEDSPIYDLIVNHHISGVILDRENDNFVASPDTLSGLSELTGKLQNLNREVSLLGIIPDPQEPDNPPSVYVPLFITMELSSSNGMYSQILEGLSDVPVQMAIGATWDPSMAFQAGSTIGREFEALGINLLVAPSLDVLEDTRVSQAGDIGVQSFGGDPFWVSQMGSAFIAGVHTATEGSMGVVATHFPGLGSSDRSSDQEVATVRKSLEQLKQIELTPFFAVAGTAPGDAPETADGFMTSHIRYQGFTGNIRATTRPVSLDPQAFSQLMALEPLSMWREGGGIALSDALGARSIRRFSDPLELSFQPHLVARDAFLAGNDLLWIEDFQNPEDPDEYATVLSTLSFFTTKYLEDPGFAQRVDRSVLRILRLKLRLFGNFESPGIFEPTADFAEIGSDLETSPEIAARSATLINPDQDEIDDRVGGKPRIGERIVFFTDARLVRQCTGCEPETVMPITALESSVVRLFGPSGTGEVGAWNLRSFSMADLANYLGVPPTTVPVVPLSAADDVDQAIRFADWLVFSVLDIRDETYGSEALKLMLDQRPDLARDKKLVVFAHDIPYILDATDISKVDIFYALYDSSSAFVDMAAKLLFLEDSAEGASPVSVPGIGYDLITVTSPNPEQIIQLFLSRGTVEEGEGVEEEAEGFQVGDVISVVAGPIVDANGNPVPDRTPVEFIVSQQVEGIPSYTLVSNTSRGVAQASVPLDRTGLISIVAQSGQARRSQTLQLNVQQDIPAVATVISPTPLPTSTVGPTVTPASPTPTAISEPPRGSDPESVDDMVGFGDLVTGLVAAAAVSVVGWYLAEQNGRLNVYRVRITLITFAAAMLGYNYLALSLPGSMAILDSTGAGGVFLISLLTGSIGLIASYRILSRDL